MAKTANLQTLTLDLDFGDVPAFSVPDVSPRLLWRLARFCRDIIFLAGLPDNHYAAQGGAAYAGSEWYTKKYGCSAPTLRRWAALLAKHGWIKNLSRGPHLVLIPLKTAAAALFFKRHFERLLGRFLSGFAGGIPISPDKGRSSNKKTFAKTKRETVVRKAPLPPAEAAVVVQAANAEVDPEYAETFVRKHGSESLLDAMEAVAGREAQGKKVGNRGGYIRTLAEKLAAGTAQIPGWLAEKRAQAERKRERDKAAANRVHRPVTSNEGGKPPIQAALPPSLGANEGAYDPLSTLAPDARKNLEHAAYQAELSAARVRAVREMLEAYERKGEAAPSVKVRARRMLAEGWTP